MPSFERSGKQSALINTNECYSKILATFYAGSSGDKTTISRNNRVNMVIKSQTSYEYSLASMPDDMYMRTAGADLSALFMPFETSSGNYNLPSFVNGVNLTRGSSLSGAVLTNMDLMPLAWNGISNSSG